jgi:ABC-type nickel/cobalt efflux system permease component RcnA
MMQLILPILTKPAVKYIGTAAAVLIVLVGSYSCWKKEIQQTQILKTNVQSLKKAEEVRLEKKKEIQKLEKKHQEVIKNDEVLIRQRRYFDAY